jgi:putative phosphoribosyl transferase
MKTSVFKDRIDAGLALADALDEYAGRDDVVVLGLPRGGVPVAAVVAGALEAPLDALVVRKLGVPGHPETAVGALGPGGITVLDRDLMARLGISTSALRAVIAREQRELRRRELEYRDDEPFPDLHDRTVIIVDDGLATGATMAAAVATVRQLSPAGVVVAVPVASPAACRRLALIADHIVTVRTPPMFVAVGQWYQDFRATTDDEVRRWLNGSAGVSGPVPTSLP